MTTKLVINTLTGQQTIEAVTDAELIASRMPYLALSWDGTSNTLSAQVQTPVLSDGQRNDVSEVQTWLLMVGDVETSITTDVNGLWSDTLTFTDDDDYDVYAISPDNSNTVIVKDGV